MKISNETIKLLQSFAGINNNIRIYPGKKISTISPSKKVFASSEVTEEFPVEFCVYDLNSFLSLVTLNDNPDVEFDDKKMIIKQGKSEIEFYYAAADIIIAPEKDKSIKIDDHYSFKLSSGDIQMLIKAAGALAAKAISIVSKNGSTWIAVGDPKSATSGSYRLSLPASEHEFNCVFDVENLKVIPDDYDVTISKKKVVRFKHATKVLEYYIALDLTSTV